MHMLGNCNRRFGWLVAVTAFVSGCGGGGGGGGGVTSTPASPNNGSFTLSDVKYGRLADDGTGPVLVSPLTTATIARHVTTCK